MSLQTTNTDENVTICNETCETSRIVTIPSELHTLAIVNIIFNNDNDNDDDNDDDDDAIGSNENNYEGISVDDTGYWTNSDCDEYILLRNVSTPTQVPTNKRASKD